MDITTIAIWISLILAGLGVLFIVLSGIRSIAQGKFRMSSLIGMVVPLVVFGIAYALSAGAPDPMASAAVLTCVILLFLGVVAVLIMGLKGVIGF